jgi:hypothetical protein
MSFEFSYYIKLMNEKKLDEALEYRKLHMPKKLYKYISLSDNYNCDKDNQPCVISKDLNELKFKTLQNDEIWLSRFDNLNDPYEYKAMYLKSRELADKGWPIDMLEGYLNRMKNVHLICSFSTNLVDNMPMWAHYSNNHKGFCVEYDVLNPKVVFPISYEKERFGIASILTSIFKLSNEVTEGKIDYNNKDFQFYMSLITHFGLIKHSSWTYENEYRILYADYGGTNSGTVMPTIKVGLYASRIYVGSQCSPENKDRLIEISKIIGVKAYEMYLDDKEVEYKLSYRQI